MNDLLVEHQKYDGYSQVPQGIRGIYICLDTNEKPLYVGQSCNIRKRFSSHSRLKDICKHGFKWLVVIPVPKTDLDYQNRFSSSAGSGLDFVEHEWIQKLKPVLNIMPVRGYGKGNYNDI